jgi:hypothetical protein
MYLVTHTEVFMKKIFTALVVFAALATAVSAQETVTQSSLHQELAATLEEVSSTQIGTLTIGDMMKIAERVSIAQQKLHYVQKARMASFMVPGAGQFMTGDSVGGALFLAGDIVVMTGTLVGAYFLLPADLQFNPSLNYFTSSFSQIRTTWGNHSFVDLLPSMGLMAGGFLLKGILGHFSAAGAANGALRNIADGKVTFTPNLGFMNHGFGMGMRMQF